MVTFNSKRIKERIIANGGKFDNKSFEIKKHVMENQLVLVIENDGQELKKTNFWESEYNARGFFYVSTNAGCFRMLVPESQESAIKEMQTGKFVEISRTTYQGRKMVRLLFDDSSDYPYSLDLSHEQFDRLPSLNDSGRELRFIAYAKSGKVMDLKCLLK